MEWSEGVRTIGSGDDEGDVTMGTGDSELGGISVTGDDVCSIGGSGEIARADPRSSSAAVAITAMIFSRSSADNSSSPGGIDELKKVLLSPKTTAQPIRRTSKMDEAPVWQEA